MGTARLLLPRIKSAASYSARFLSSSAALIRRSWTNLSDDSEDTDGESPVYKRALKLQRPTIIKYQEHLHNSVSLIGVIELPLKQCNIGNGKFGVHTSLRVKSSAGFYSNHFRMMLIFWDEMAEMSVHHLKPKDLVYVSGPIVSFVKVDKDGKRKHYYKVCVKEINFIAEDGNCPAFRKVSEEDIKEMHRKRLHLWHVYFANPNEWWDNRKDKFNPRSPDFKHKDTGEVLYLKETDPPWIKQQLELLESRLSGQNLGEPRRHRAHLTPLVYDDAEGI